MLTQAQAFEIIANERKYQDKLFNPNEKLDSGNTRQQRDSEVLPHLVLLQAYVTEAMADWTFSHKRGHTSGSLPALQGIAKIAAIAERALERVGFSDKLLTTGLR